MPNWPRTTPITRPSVIWLLGVWLANSGWAATSPPLVAARLVDGGAPDLVFAWTMATAPTGGELLSVSLDGGASWSPPLATRTELRLAAGTFDPLAASLEVPGALRADSTSDLRIVQLVSPSLAPIRQRLRELGAEVVGFIPYQAHIVRLHGITDAELRRQPFVRWVGPLHPAYKLATPLRAHLLAASTPGDEPVRYVLRTFTAGPAEKGLLASEVLATGGEVGLQSPYGYTLHATLTRAQATTLLGSDHLLWIEPWSAPEPDMDNVRVVSGANYVDTIAGYDGTGVRGEVFDGGTDLDHPDFGGIIEHGPAVSAGDHGTATYGIVFGKGIGDPAGLGHLPRAQGYFADYDVVADRYAHTAELVRAPIEAVFQSNSWGDALTRSYTSTSAEMDDIIYLNDIAIFQSQSNFGTQDSRPQAWAKNIISIGGIRHYDTQALTDDCWCDGASVGPAADGRLKPDLSHFYDATFCTDAEPGGYSAGDYTPGFGGTSGATPITAGIGGLVFEMWADNIYGNNPPGPTVFAKRPHAATLKAILINTAEQYPFTGTGHDKTRVHQGWGLANARNVLDRAPLTQIINETSPLESFEGDQYLVTVSAGQPDLKVTMAYTDWPGSPLASVALVNDLTLRLEAPDGTVYWGNNRLDAAVWSAPGGTADRVNNVENVFVLAPMAGDWLIEVAADAIVDDAHVETPADDQDYGLVVYGGRSLRECRLGIAPPTGVGAVAIAPNQVRVTWSGTVTDYRVYRAEGGCGLGPQVAIASISAARSFDDLTVSGGVTYGYTVTAVGQCESVASACVNVTATGTCLFDATFAGVETAAGNSATSCGVALDWSPGTTRCAGPIVYNVYRSTTARFTPDPTNLVASCVATANYLDQDSLDPVTTYYYLVRAEDLGGVPNGGPCGGREEANLIHVDASPNAVHRADFELGANGWTSFVGTPAASSGLFVVGDPVGTNDAGNPAQPEDDHTVVGLRCLYTAENPGGGLGADDIDDGEVIALSPRIDASRFTSLRLSLWRWHFNRDLGEDTGDYFALEVSDDGGGRWLTVDSLDETQLANAWTEVTVSLETIVPLTNDMRLRVRAADGDSTGNIIEVAIDDVSLTSNGVCAPVGACGSLLAVGNTLLGRKLGNDVDMRWTDPQPAVTWNFYRSTSKAAIGSATPRPLTSSLDVGAVPSPPSLYFYRVRAVGCSGTTEGP